jgi:hypothetical protein
MSVDTNTSLVFRIRMNGGVPPLLHTPLCSAQRQLYVTLLDY